MIAMGASTKDGNKNAAVIGLSQEDIEKMTLSGDPMVMQADHCESLGLGHAELFIFYGSTELAMVERLERSDLIPPGTIDEIKADLESRKSGDLAYRFDPPSDE
jgi:hypothetical protein